MSLSENDANQLSGFLSNITANTELEALALVTREGMRLAFSAIPEYTIDPDAFCAMSAVLLQSGTDSVEKIGYNKLIEVVLRGIHSFMVISSAGRFFLIGASRNIKDLGKTVTVFRYYANKIGESYPKLT
jgi:predicted regulator of Ras-like GTPase activity (Roadblock/LC7/MglB family)